MKQMISNWIFRFNLRTILAQEYDPSSQYQIGASQTPRVQLVKILDARLAFQLVSHLISLTYELILPNFH